MGYGWGALTGSKDEAEKEAKRAKDAENDAANDIVGKTNSIQRRDQEIKNAAVKALQDAAAKAKKDQEDFEDAKKKAEEDRNQLLAEKQRLIDEAYAEGLKRAKTKKIRNA